MTPAETDRIRSSFAAQSMMETFGADVIEIEKGLVLSLIHI